MDVLARQATELGRTRMDRVDVSDRKVEVVRKRSSRASGRRHVDEPDDHAATVEVVPATPDRPTRCIKEGLVERHGGLEMLDFEQEAEETGGFFSFAFAHCRRSLDSMSRKYHVAFQGGKQRGIHIPAGHGLLRAKYNTLTKGGSMLQSYTARYAKIESGYLGQLLEWPEVVTEGSTIEECRAMLRDALHEMVLAYRQLGKEVPVGNDLFEQVAVDLDDVRQTA